MTTYTDYQKLLYAYNFTGNASGTSSVPSVTLTEETGRYVVPYSILDNSSDVANLGEHYPTGSAEELHFASSSYDYTINTRLASILSASNLNDERMLFSDVANITFTNTNQNSNGTFDSGEDVGLVTFGQLKNSYDNPNFSPTNTAFTTPYNGSSNTSSGKHGDVWFNVDHNIWGAQYSDISIGDASYTVLLEEITHTLGVDVLKDSQNINSYFDSEKYTVTVPRQVL